MATVTHWNKLRQVWLPYLVGLLPPSVPIPTDYKIWSHGDNPSTLYFALAYRGDQATSGPTIQMSISARPDDNFPNSFRLETGGKEVKTLSSFFLLKAVYEVYPKSAAQLRTHAVLEPVAVLARVRQLFPAWNPAWDFGIVLFREWVRLDYRGDSASNPIWTQLDAWAYDGTDQYVN